MINNSLLPSTLQFPCEKKIISYLEQHSKTNKKLYSCFSNGKIIEAVAKVFADKAESPYDVDKKVMTTVDQLGLKYEPIVEAAINVALMHALKHCALGKSQDAEKDE